MAAYLSSIGNAPGSVPWSHKHHAHTHTCTDIHTQAKHKVREIGSPYDGGSRQSSRGHMRFRAFDTLTKDRGSYSSTHTVSQNHL